MAKKQVSLDERFAGLSQAKAAAQALVSFWDALEAAEPANEEEAATVQRWKARTERALDALRTVDPVLFDGPLAATVREQADAATTHVKQGVSNPNAPVQADNLHRTILTLVALPAGGDQARPLAYVTDDAVALVGDLQQEVKRLRSSVKRLEEEREQLVNEMQHRIESSDETVESHVQRLGARVGEEIGRVEAQLEGDREAFVKARQDHDDEAEDLISTLKQKVSLAADGSLSVGYENAATAEEKSADRLRNLAIGFAVLSLILAVGAVLLSGTDSQWTGWDMAPAKLAAVAAPAAIATYLGRESSGHRGEAWRLRQVRLELSNLGEYLSELGPEQRAEVRKILVARYFATNSPQPGEGNGYAPPAQLLMATLAGGAGTMSPESPGQQA